MIFGGFFLKVAVLCILYGGVMLETLVNKKNVSDWAEESVNQRSLTFAVDWHPFRELLVNMYDSIGTYWDLLGPIETDWDRLPFLYFWPA